MCYTKYDYSYFSYMPKRRPTPHPHSYPDLDAVDTTTIGERGQVVIPASIRGRMGLKAGDRMVVFVHPAGPLFMMPVKYLKKFMTSFVKRLGVMKF